MKKVIQGVIVALGLTVSFKNIKTTEGYSLIYKTLTNDPYLTTFALVGCVLFFILVDRLKQKTNILQKIVSLFFAICTWFTTIYEAGIDTANKVFHHPISLLYSILFVVSFYLIIESLQKILTYFSTTEHQTIKLPISRKLQVTFANHPFLVPFGLMMCVWLYIAVTAYPSVFMGDTLDQIEQYFHYQVRTAAHPVLSTVLIGSLVKFGAIINHPNIGLFIFTILQVTLVASSMAYAISTVYKLTLKTKMLMIVTVVMTFIPMVNASVILATKDIIFSVFFVVYMTTTATYFFNQEMYRKNKMFIMTFLSVLLMLLFRYNTLHFIALTLVVYIIGGLILRRKIYLPLTIVPMMILGLVCGTLINNIFVSQFAEAQPKPNRREMLSLPFQHTARYIKYHEDDISSNDKAIINNVLKYDVIRKSYVPHRSDAVKRTHDENATKAEMSQYFNLVGRQIKKHPFVLVESVMANHSNLFNLNLSVNWYYSNGLIDSDGENQVERVSKIGLTDNSLSVKLNRGRVKLYQLWDRLPLLSQINNYGTYIFVMLAVFVLWLRQKKFLLAAIVIPMGAFLGTLIAGPITLGYIRYILPLVLFTPLLLVLAMSSNREGEKH
ncbi:hypothetical protein CBF34_02960 [Vagococcus penaei]|uniref:Uncharacterized protein n=1 Tax=Vagococcus penaei TaxID=633807 RepID=A0A1Q2D422_9ENTE|nr:DUF6020 family protein [Vagococcus penaei]AQP53051.1 hypothetical protein BW732_01625 [Vagococcus penaei]RSU06086.1 hypothetical protein CBF34_02960 [Vagococcus penaei]